MSLGLAKRCPACSHRLTWAEKWRFTKWWGARRESTCPACGELLIWARAPWQAMNVLAIALAVVLLTAPWPWRPVFALLVFAALAGASLSLRLVRPPDMRSMSGGRAERG